MSPGRHLFVQPGLAWRLGLLALALAGKACGEIAPLLPDGAALSPWKVSGRPESFTRDTLWELMDGGAEVYREYGVVGAVSGRYENGAGGSVLAEIYTMTDAEAAYGILSLNARGNGRELKLGDAASVAKYYLLFSKGNRYVSLTAENDEEGGGALCLDLARRLEAVLPPGGRRPALLTRISEFPRGEGLPIYLRGSLALLNLYPFGSRDPFKAAEGVEISEGATQVFVLRYPDGPAAVRAASEAWAALSADTRFRADAGGMEPALIDEKGRFLLLRRQDDAIVVGIGPARADLERRLSRLR